MIVNLFWRIVAFAVSRPWIAERLIARAMRTPYFHLPGYMERWWLFNGYPPSDGAGDHYDRRRFSWLPSIRIHHILRADTADHPHDHPWDARTIVLRGWYIERRALHTRSGIEACIRHTRLPGDTATIDYGDFHHIEEVTAGGVWTLFITGGKRGGWGFLVNGVKVPWREYEARFPSRTDAEVVRG